MVRERTGHLPSYAEVKKSTALLLLLILQQMKFEKICQNLNYLGTSNLNRRMSSHSRKTVKLQNK